MDSTVADLYQRFADIEARGVSDTYDEWASAIARDPQIVAMIAQLPGIKKQPNLVFAAARSLGASVGPYDPFRAWLLTHWPDVVPVIMSRATQTNEAARCAVLLPVLSRLPGPLALIEAGASAGLVLYPDRYSYRYDVNGSTVDLHPDDGPSTVVIPCAIDASSVPTRLPEIVWRAGVDVNPIDVRDADQVNWLETLVWPEHDTRRERLHAAASLVAADPPDLMHGDLLEAVPTLVERAPSGSSIIVFHSAVLNYLSSERRQSFAHLMSTLPDVTWISNEGPGVLPAVTEQVDVGINGETILAVDGRPVALVGPHGQSYRSLQADLPHAVATLEGKAGLST